jgi:SpoIID/LytB domain protein
VPSAQQTGVASLIVDLRSGATISVEQPRIIGRPLLPGSVMKIAAVAAALESGIINERSTIICTRTITVDGHQLTCTHPDLHRRLTAAEALAHSCNIYVATIAARLPRASFDRALADLGLPASAPAASVRASALGIEGQRATPLALIQAVARIADTGAPPAWKPATLATMRAGLHDAARVGTAAALGAAGVDALAKTGTVGAGGRSQGLIVGVTPAGHPVTGFALLISGGGGADAAALVASRLHHPAGASSASIAPSPPVERMNDVAKRSSDAAHVVRIGVAQRDGRLVVKSMPLDDYVAGVIAGEAPGDSPPAAMDALAIAARTYALANAGRHAAEGFDLCDLTHCQVLRAATKASAASAARTTGRFLGDRGKPANVFYTASCGGYSERPSAVWRGAIDPPYLPARRDDACDGEPGWQSDISARDLLRALRAGGFSGDTLRDMSIASRTSSGRAAWLHLNGLSPGEISGDNLRTLVGRVLGWQLLKSTLFDVQRTGSGFRFRGQGAGHGVGLCVLGAAQQARYGASSVAILRSYYPGLVIRALNDGANQGLAPLQLQLPVEQESERAALDRHVRQLLNDVRLRLQADPPDRLLLRFHPTVESYQRETRSAWFTAGTTRGATVDLLPLPVLRRRGILDSTLRHELAHALTRDALEGAPRWMHEGVAEWAARGSAAAIPPSATTTRPCPVDVDFRNAASAQALQQLYDRALDCYERELRSGRRSWRPASAGR